MVERIKDNDIHHSKYIRTCTHIHTQTHYNEKFEKPAFNQRKPSICKHMHVTVRVILSKFRVLPDT